MINIDEHIPSLINYCQNNQHIIAMYLYGFYGTKYQTPLSDVDLAVILDLKKDFNLADQLELHAEICEVLREDDVNLTVLNRAPLTMMFKVISTGCLIYERDPQAVNNFHERVFKEYRDFSLDLSRFQREFDVSLREAYLNGQQR
ncbi:MAG: nucleotidyltransferase domain-containing protein [Firmicutes bacterium]|nr:nucleotidyltransferase domain-containing protein [Bacillota bacterium]